MAKLFATLETSTGKVVKVSDNEQIIATVYDGNLKAYSVIIEWCIVGDPEHYEADGSLYDTYEEAQATGKPVTTIPAVMGAIVTSREWRNQPDDRRKAQGKA